jgi:hypothetical protein
MGRLRIWSGFCYQQYPMAFTPRIPMPALLHLGIGNHVLPRVATSSHGDGPRR